MERLVKQSGTRLLFIAWPITFSHRYPSETGNGDLLKTFTLSNKKLVQGFVALHNNKPGDKIPPCIFTFLNVIFSIVTNGSVTHVVPGSG